MKKVSAPRQRNALSREQIIDAAIVILDERGEAGLTFQALAKTLATGAGAIYWHVENRDDLMIAACDVVVAKTLDTAAVDPTPADVIRAAALGLFDAMDAHPWVGSALARSAAKMPMIRIMERFGQQVRALGVGQADEWKAVSALFSYVLGVGGQNAANAQFALRHGLERSKFLAEVAATWAKLDQKEFPFTSSIAPRLPAHDDRADFVAGIDLLLRGMELWARR